MGLWVGLIGGGDIMHAFQAGPRSLAGRDTVAHNLAAVVNFFENLHFKFFQISAQLLNVIPEAVLTVHVLGTHFARVANPS